MHSPELGRKTTAGEARWDAATCLEIAFEVRAQKLRFPWGFLFRGRRASDSMADAMAEDNVIQTFLLDMRAEDIVAAIERDER